jgi:hypothetical protein
MTERNEDHAKLLMHLTNQLMIYHTSALENWAKLDRSLSHLLHEAKTEVSLINYFLK